jgi:ribosomal protein L11 methylase PrmA
MRRLIVVAALVLAILAGSLGGYSRAVAAADAPYSCTATGPGLTVAASGLTKEQAEAFQESYEAQGASVKCKKKPSATAVSR